MSKLVIIGAGGFGREVAWLVERVNQIEPKYDLAGFVDDGKTPGEVIGGYPVLGSTEWLLSQEEKLCVVIAVGNAMTRKRLAQLLQEKEELSFPNLIDPSVRMSKRVRLGKGNIITAGTTMTVDILLGDFNILNLHTTVGHDVRIESYVTVYPGANISGAVHIGECCELGTGCQIIQGISIAKQVVLGAGAVVTKQIAESGTYVGVPVHQVEKEGKNQDEKQP
ncbi:MAG: acetyltransferase [Clostridiales bacterium]|nr:acetyltransferase [Clostridiales bacterium]